MRSSTMVIKHKIFALIGGFLSITLIIAASAFSFVKEKGQRIDAADELTSLTVLNPVSHPLSSDMWEIKFEVRGREDLFINSENEASLLDLEFVELECDGTPIPEPQLVSPHTRFSHNFSCSGTASLTYRIKQAGDHTISLHFGDLRTIAHNNDVFQWSERLGSVLDEYGYYAPFAIATDTSDRILLTWEGTGDSDLNGDGDMIDSYENTPLGNDDVLVSVFDNSGTFQWSKRLGGAGYDGGVSITSDSLDRVILTGKVTGAADLNGDGDTVDANEGSGYGGIDIFVSAFDFDGSFLWAERIGGASNDDYAQGIDTDLTNRVIIVGNVRGVADLNGDGDTADANESDSGFGDIDCIYSVFSPSGVFQFSERLGGVGFDVGSGVVADHSDRIVVTGRVEGTVDLNGDGDKVDTHENASYGGHDAFVSVFDSTGIFLWSERIGGSNNDAGYSVATDENNRVIVCGHTNGAADLNGDGDLLDENETAGYGDYDGFLSVFDGNGVFAWSERIGGMGEDVSYDIATDTANRIFMFGYVFEDADLNGDEDTDDDHEEDILGDYDVFWSVFDENGAFEQAERLGGAGPDFGYSVATDTSNNTAFLGIVDESGDLNGDGDMTDPNESSGYGGGDLFLSVFETDLVPPIKSNFVPASGSTIYDSTPTITFELEQEGDCRASTGDESFDDMFDDTDCSGDGTTEISCTLSDLGTFGNKNIFIACQDIYENKDSSATNTALTYTYADPATLAPELTINPVTPDPTKDQTPAVHGTASDTTDTVSSVQYQADSTSGPWSSCIPDDTLFDENTETFTCLISTALFDGLHTIFVRASDSEGNTTSDGSYATDSFTIDTIPPSISITFIDHFKVTPTRWLTNRTPLFEGNTEPNTHIQVELPDIGMSRWFISDQSGFWRWQSESALSLGLHKVTFTAWDSAANEGSDEVTIVVIAASAAQEELPEEQEEDEQGEEDEEEQAQIPEEEENRPDMEEQLQEEPQKGLIELLPFIAEIGDSVGQVLGSVTNDIKQFNTATPAKAASYTFVTITAFTGGAQVTASTGTSLFQLPFLLSNTFLGGLFGFGRKRKPWGVVYDSVTKEPLSRAVVRVFSQDTLVQTTVTDINGVFTVNLKPGMYTLKVQKGTYSFPSTLITGSTDGGRTPIYRGGGVRAPEQNYTFSMFVPLDPQTAKTGGRILTQARSLGSLFLNSGVLAILIFGALFSFWSFLATHSLLYLLLGILNGVMLLLNLFTRAEAPRKWGTILEEDGTPVAGLEVGLFDAQYGKLVDNRITDSDGKYRFIVPGGKYLIRPVGTNYVLTESIPNRAIEAGQDTDHELVIAEKITVRKVNQSIH